MKTEEIDERYIAGFFDGEGSALVLAVKLKTGRISIRPTIKIELLFRLLSVS